MRMYQYLAGLGANFGMMSVGMHFGWSSSSLPKFINGTETPFCITSDDASWLASMLSLGAIVGDLIAVFTLDKLGRKFLILGLTLPLAVSWLLVANATAVVYLYVGRFLGGVADGIAFSTIPPYLTEISDPEIRGFLGSTYPVTLELGMLVINVAELYLSMRASAYFAVAISLSTLLVMPFVPESPYFYVMKNKKDAAVNSLRKFRGRWNVSKDMERICEGLEEESESLTCTGVLFTRLSLKAIAISAGILLFQQLNGITAIISYTTTILEESKDFLDPTKSNIIFYAIYTVAALVGVLLVDIFGRKPLILFSLITSTIMLFVIATYLYIKIQTTINVESYGYIEVLSVFLYAMTISVGLLFIPLLVASEILPTNIKACGMLLINICFSLSSTLTIKFFRWSSDAYGMYLPFYVFVLFSIMGVIFVIRVVPETKGKTLEEVHKGINRRESEKPI